MTLIHPFTCPQVYPSIHSPTHIPSRYSTTASGTPTVCVVEGKELKVPSCDLRRLKSPGEEKQLFHQEKMRRGIKAPSVWSLSLTLGV